MRVSEARQAALRRCAAGRNIGEINLFRMAILLLGTLVFLLRTQRELHPSALHTLLKNITNTDNSLDLFFGNLYTIHKF